MNVINKLKSKKNRQTTSQLPGAVQHSQPVGTAISSPAQEEDTFTLPEPPEVSLRQVSEVKTYSNQSERYQDLDEVNISEYNMRKDKQKQLLTRMEGSDNFNQEHLKQKHYSLGVRKNFTIADISVFEGELVLRDEGRVVYRRKVKLSCNSEAVPFPDNIGTILLTKVTMLSDSEGLFVGHDVIKISEKRGNKR